MATTTSSVFQMMESLVPRGALRSHTARATASEFWRRVVGQPERTTEEEPEEEVAVECTTEQEPSGPTTTTLFHHHNQQQQRDVFVHEMRLRDHHGVSLRTHAYNNNTNNNTTHHHPPTTTTTTTTTSAVAASTVPDLTVPLAPGSTDYIYLPQ
mmetsp:Transcript_10008/g.27688  ORF Transcript_10008/g.27688 Transcript_10008/m.27688 type:complete len:154 (-) Transcript_10008:213-674(-)|eukprot:CAMPEP_0168738128 /NCGR_PEP_ID=MMETSP0724-20121128/10767_1 /TAXON_ID=265536 /ORGANISM="Amphiprora sp., Strain CCMP467" /LENGTH=153 /DNA_ID=CAMNT_0008785449 /DNA_START=45 /DNA_END=506 /DNA_ORIENTATION=-